MYCTQSDGIRFVISRLKRPILAGEPSRICYIHVGTHKTGTTSIQAFLRDNEERFASYGVCIPRSGRGEDDAGHHNLTQELLAGGDFYPERGGLGEVAAELRRSEKPIACVSSEDFSLVSRSAESLTQLREEIIATGFTPRIVIYLRPQVSYSVSIYAEIVKNGNHKPFATYLAEIGEHGSFLWNGSLGPLFRYDVLLERFAAVFGSAAIVVRRYHSSAPRDELLRSFARLVIGTKIDFRPFTFPPEKFNPALTFERVLTALGITIDMVDMRFAPLTVRETLSLAASFYRANRTIAQRYNVWIAPCDIGDVLLALPLRKTFERTASLTRARAALHAYEG